jgi:hypothetical protein
VDAHESNLKNIDDGWLRMMRMCGLFSSWNHCDRMLQVWDTVRIPEVPSVIFCDQLCSIHRKLLRPVAPLRALKKTLLQRGNIRKPAMESVDHQVLPRGSHWVPSIGRVPVSMRWDFVWDIHPDSCNIKPFFWALKYVSLFEKKLAQTNDSKKQVHVCQLAHKYAKFGNIPQSKFERIWLLRDWVTWSHVT